MIRESPNGDRLWDVVVVGAGPAGATAATHLADSGHSVLLLDKHPFPRDKVCGDALIPDALKSLRTLGLYDRVRQEGFPVDCITVLSPSGIRVEIPAHCVTLKRRQLDKLIVDEAVTRGCTFEVALVQRIRQEKDGNISADVAHFERPIRARIAILATGADITLLEDLSMVDRRQHNGIAARCYVNSPVRIDDLVVSFDRAIAPGYAWIFPMGNNEYNVGCGVFFNGNNAGSINLRAAFARFASSPIARDLMDRASFITQLEGARLRAGLAGSSFYNGGGILSIGETAGTTYPFTGEGIGKAMETGSLAASQIRTALRDTSRVPLREFKSRVDEQLKPRYFGYDVAQRWISKPWLSDLIAMRVRHSRRLQRLTTGIINETADPRSVFTWRVLLPHWLRWFGRD